MKIKIVESFDEREFDLDEGDVVKLGSSSDNDIVIKSPSVAEKHLTLSVLNNEVYATDLGSGKPSFIDDEPLVPGEEKTLNSFFPIIIGDIKISVEDEVLSSTVEDVVVPEEVISRGMSIANEIEKDEDLNSSPNTRLSDDELIDQIKKQYKKNSDESSKTSVIGSHLEFRPDSAPKMRQATGSTKIHLNTKKKKISKSSENYNELLKKRKKKVKDKSEIGPLLIFFLGIILAGLTYYIQFYKPQMDAIAKDVKKSQLPSKNLELSVLFEDKLINQKDLFSAYLSGDRCNQPISLKICDQLKERLNTTEKRSILYNGTLILGISNNELKLLENSLLNKFDISKNDLQKIVERDYSDYFTFSEFEKNGFKPTLFGNVTKGDTYNKINIFYMVLLDLFHGKFKDLKGSGVSSIMLFSFEEDPKNLYIDGFLKVSELNSISNPLLFVDEVRDIVVLDKYLLNNNIEEFYNARISSHINNFDSALSQKIYFNDIVLEMLADKGKSNCNGDGAKICSLLKKASDEEFLVQINDGFVFIQFSPKWVKLLPKGDDYKLSRIEKDSSVSLLKSKFEGVDTIKYIKNDYVLSDIEPSIQARNLMAYLFIETDLFNLVGKDFSNRQIVLGKIGADSDHFLILDGGKIKNLNKQLFESQKLLFARTKVPYYLINIDPFVNQKIKLQGL